MTWYPEPCESCDNGHACETHNPVVWGDSWLTPKERKHATLAARILQDGLAGKPHTWCAAYGWHDSTSH